MASRCVLRTSQECVGGAQIWQIVCSKLFFNEFIFFKFRASAAIHWTDDKMAKLPVQIPSCSLPISKSNTSRHEDKPKSPCFINLFLDFFFFLNKESNGVTQAMLKQKLIENWTSVFKSACKSMLEPPEVSLPWHAARYIQAGISIMEPDRGVS